MQPYKLNETITTAGLKVKETYRPEEAGKILDCSSSTIYRLIKSGALVARRLRGSFGHYRITRAALGEYLAASTLKQE